MRQKVKFGFLLFSVTILSLCLCFSVNYHGNERIDAQDILINDIDSLRTSSGMDLTKTADISDGMANDVEIVGSIAYVANGWGGLEILNVSNPAVPTLISEIEDGGNAQNLEIMGNYAFVAEHEDGLKIYDISTPSSPLKYRSLMMEGLLLTSVFRDHMHMLQMVMTD